MSINHTYMTLEELCDKFAELTLNAADAPLDDPRRNYMFEVMRYTFKCGFTCGAANMLEGFRDPIRMFEIALGKKVRFTEGMEKAHDELANKEVNLSCGS